MQIELHDVPAPEPATVPAPVPLPLPPTPELPQGIPPAIDDPRGPGGPAPVTEPPATHPPAVAM